MDKFNLIRSGIFLVAGILLIVFPKETYKVQVRLIRKLNIKYKLKRNLKPYLYIGIGFMVISLILFAMAVV